MTSIAGRALHFTYTNHRGEVARRWATPVGISALRWGVSDWHPSPGWLLRAFDHEKGEEREFRLEDCQFEPTAEMSAEQNGTKT